MKKPAFTHSDIDEQIEKHPDFDRISGSYTLSTNSVIMGQKEHGLHFYCSKKDLSDFIEKLTELLLALSAVSAKQLPLAWIPFPGVTKEKVLSRYKNIPDKTLELISTDPEIIIVQKIDDSGKILRWDTLDGRIGHGGFST